MFALSQHPPGTYLLCFTEMLERFSYYAMSGLLVLFLAGAPASGGLGWPSVVAIEIYGIYVGGLWFVPLLGGWIGDRLLGPRRAVILGGVLIAAGQALMMSPAVIPAAIEAVSGVPVVAALRTAGVPLGYPLLSDRSYDTLVAALPGGASAADARMLMFAYFVPAGTFFLGLLCLAIGNGLLKPNITVMLGQMYRVTDAKRDEAFTLFYIGINIGAVLSAVVAGTVAERVGWSFGFGVASAVMTIGLGALLLLRHLIPPDVGARARASEAEASSRPLPRRALTYVVILTLFAALFWGAFMQTGGLLNLFTYREVDRTVAGFTVPAPWFGSLTPFFLTLLGPLFQATLNFLARRGRIPQTVSRFVVGMVIAAAAFAILAIAVWAVPAHARMSMLWLLLFYLMLSLGELSLSPAGNAMAARYVPPELSGRMMAIWFLCYGMGSFLSAGLGGLSGLLQVGTVLAVVAVLLLAAGAVLAVLRRRIEALVATAPAPR